MTDTLVIDEDFVWEEIIAQRIKKERPLYLDVGGTIVPVRGDVKDFPDITQGHYAVSRVFGNVLVPRRGEITTFPDVTQSHLSFLHALGADILRGQPNVVDLGCGAGFLGTHLGKNFALERLVFSDLSEKSLAHARKTYEINSQRDFKTSVVEFRHGDATTTLKDLEGGVAVCAPYLIPEVCTEFPGVYNLFARVARDQGMELYVGHSNLSEKLVDAAAETSGLKRVEIYRIENLPLVPEYASDRFPSQVAQKRAGKLFPETVEFLKGRGLREEGGKYFHDVLVSRISRKG